MRCLYREKMYQCGNYLDIEIFPVFAPPRSVRSKKAKPTKKAQEMLNQRNAAKKIIRLANTNFTEKDLRFDLTYSQENEPENPQEAQRLLQNFIKRLKRFRKRNGLPELKYIAVTETGKRKNRIHHHLILSGGVSINDLARIWGLGYTSAKPLQFDKKGISALAAYMTKAPLLYRRWNASKNLQKPKVTQRDGRISGKLVKELHNLANDAGAEYERRYSGYLFAEASPFYNDCNEGFYLSVHMYKPRPQRLNPQIKKE